MNKLNIGKFFGTIPVVLKKHSPEILTGIGIAGLFITPVLAVKATPKALERIEEEKSKKWVDKLTPVETVKATWKCYIPAATSAVTSAACIIGANTVHARRIAALTTAYTMSESTLREYKEKVLETIGEKKEQVIRDEIDKSRLEKNPVSRNEVIITQKGNTLCYDHWSKRYFYSDIQTIRKIQNDLNEKLLTDIGGNVTLNDLYFELGLDPLPTIGDDLGWYVDRGKIAIHIGSGLADDDRPCVVIDFDNPPTYGI